MNILKAITAREYKLAFDCGLQMVGVEDNLPQWLGDNKQWGKYEALATRYNHI